MLHNKASTASGDIWISALFGLLMCSSHFANMIPPSTSVQSAPLVCVCCGGPMMLWQDYLMTHPRVRLSAAPMLGHQCIASNISAHWLYPGMRTYRAHTAPEMHACSDINSMGSHWLTHSVWQSKALSDNLWQPAVCYITNRHTATI